MTGECDCDEPQRMCVVRSASESTIEATKFMRKIAGALLVCGVLAGCAGSGAKRGGVYDPATQARIRVYLGAYSHFYFNTTCEPADNWFAKGAPGIDVAVPGFTRAFAGNETIGMPVPADAYKYYDEYVIKAGQPLTITFRVGGDRVVDLGMAGKTTISQRVQHIARSFVPLPGNDYEVFPYDAAWGLEAKLRQLHVEGSRVSTTDVQLAAAQRCR